MAKIRNTKLFGEIVEQPVYIDPKTGERHELKKLMYYDKVIWENGGIDSELYLIGVGYNMIWGSGYPAHQHIIDLEHKEQTEIKDGGLGYQSSCSGTGKFRCFFVYEYYSSTTTYGIVTDDGEVKFYECKRPSAYGGFIKGVTNGIIYSASDGTINFIQLDDTGKPIKEKVLLDGLEGYEFRNDTMSNTSVIIMKYVHKETAQGIDISYYDTYVISEENVGRFELPTGTTRYTYAQGCFHGFSRYSIDNATGFSHFKIKEDGSSFENTDIDVAVDKDSCICYDSQKKRYILWANSNNVYTSTNGKSWTKQNVPETLTLKELDGDGEFTENSGTLISNGIMKMPQQSFYRNGKKVNEIRGYLSYGKAGYFELNGTLVFDSLLQEDENNVFINTN